MKHNIYTLLITYVLSTLSISLFQPTDNLLGGGNFLHDVLIISIYTLPGLFLYLFPLSFAINFVSQKAPDARFAFSFNMYIAAGLAPVFLLGFLALFSLITSLIYFAVGEVLRLYYLRNKVVGD
ncbi:hypothetical protein [Alkalicoccobacillus porphyridii]|uniref:Uncharacterized protein n=1 Tax=Alkalicoccobacillus porphyridii TaxID=2597270 RepID=A0A553ZWX3_9BACI|nr:hypothetical protein [Alkalicoccobacillus porphyridii]TSB45943.1 hypothetical protein FN960_13620 [Alkalicoccobacillus porphyridii]